ncbi:putative bifunctional diguanylate cyclase/phosphodiesterase [Arcobacter cloacae]|uniref:Diguanylate cyclase n=1 Tax=Arcobacter cloacae TaxID=1054034 RepID=A0A6M8NAX5_9BACT|nr:EAL domain-containing protein [Arcobacter cloacae]QKF91218.1 diguanylate cyclase/phosphodiesterase [Arcobacter cloacae]RXI37511.1 diguanylate cyclase [Arcobacter cloacae]
MLKEIETIVENSGTLIYIIDLNNHEILYANKKCKEEFGNILNKVCFKVLQKEKNKPCNFCPLNQNEIEANLLPFGTLYKWEHKNTLNNKYYMFVSHVSQWTDGRKVNIQFGIDITEQKKLESQILKEKDDFIETFKTIIDSTLEGIIIYDENKRCIQVNKVVLNLFGYEEDEMLNRYALDFIAPNSKELVKRVIQNHNQEAYEADMIRKDGTTFPAILRGKDLKILDKKIRISAVMDISELKLKEKKILQLAQYDHLTNLPNRLLLKELFSYMEKRIKREKSYGALLFIDLDHFKMINDTKGHTIGDMVLVETAKRLKNILRETDFVARLGGDEFIVLIDSKDVDIELFLKDINLISNKILKELSKPYHVLDYDLRLTASIGIIQFKENADLDELMKFADTAMYSSKEKGRNRYSYFDPKLQQQIEEKVELSKELRKAIDKEELLLYYQPQIFTKNSINDIVGVEALIRWNHPEKGIISPNLFINVAEETGLIVPLGKWVLKESVKQLKIWETDATKKNWRISVNISQKQFERDNFFSLINTLIKKNNIEANKLRLEFTENLLIKNTKETLEKIQKLFNLGVTLSIDDFGTGYSSLAYLKQLPIHELKIDQSFIRDILIDSNDYSIVETILSIGRKFNLEVIAEGVETNEHHQMLVSMGCSYFQGYLFGKPSIAETF